MPLRERKEIQKVLRTYKRLIPALIILFWLVMVGMLVYREVVLPRMYRGLTSRRIDLPQDLWLGLYFSEEQSVGFVHLRTSPEERAEEKGYALSVNARVEFPLFGQETRMRIAGTAWMSGLTGLKEFDFRLNAEEHEMHIEGAVEDNTLKATLHTAGEAIPFSLPVPGELLLSGNLGMNAVSLPRLLPGQVAFVDAFDPTTMSVGRAKIEALRYETIELAGEPVDTIVVATTISGITTHAWISKEEEIVRAETPFGLIIKKIEPQDAIEPLRAEETANIIRRLSVSSTGPAPDEDAQSLRVRISGISESLMPPEDTRQRRDGDTWLITRQDPADTSLTEPFTSEDADACLGADMFIQTTHPRIREAAREIAGESGTPWEMAVRIHDWLYENIDKKSVLSVPSALSVLETMEGDCNEHAVLFTALARAAGIPTRIAIGLAWSPFMNAFGYHAWPEIYVGRWIAMDPTFGERTVNPAHIKLFTGGIDQWPRLMGYLGTMRLEILAGDAGATPRETEEEPTRP